jgi:hypothetical protein
MLKKDFGDKNHMCVRVCMYIYICIYIYIHTHSHARDHTHINVRMYCIPYFFPDNALPAPYYEYIHTEIHDKKPTNRFRHDVLAQLHCDPANFLTSDL